MSQVDRLLRRRWRAGQRVGDNAFHLVIFCSFGQTTANGHPPAHEATARQANLREQTTTDDTDESNDEGRMTNDERMIK
jgi:hypothetical protein